MHVNCTSQGQYRLSKNGTVESTLGLADGDQLALSRGRLSYFKANIRNHPRDRFTVDCSSNYKDERSIQLATGSGNQSA